MTQKVWAYHYALWRERIPPGWGLLGCLVGALGILLIGSLALSPQSNAIALKGVKAARSGEEWIPSGPPLLRPDWVISKDYAAHGGLTTAGRKYGAVDFAFWGDCHARAVTLGCCAQACLRCWDCSRCVQSPQALGGCEACGAVRRPQSLRLPLRAKCS